MVFCNKVEIPLFDIDDYVTILILVDGFLQYELTSQDEIDLFKVTILILVDGFLQLRVIEDLEISLV